MCVLVHARVVQQVLLFVTQVYRPLHAHRLCTSARTYRNIVIVCLAAVTFNVPRFCERLMDPKDPQLRIYLVIYRIVLFFLFMYLLPMAILTFLNIRLLNALKRASMQRFEIVMQMTEHRRYSSDDKKQQLQSDVVNGAGKQGSNAMQLAATVYRSGKNEQFNNKANELGNKESNEGSTGSSSDKQQLQLQQKIDVIHLSTGQLEGGEGRKGQRLQYPSKQRSLQQYRQFQQQQQQQQQQRQQRLYHQISSRQQQQQQQQKQQQQQSQCRHSPLDSQSSNCRANNLAHHNCHSVTITIVSLVAMFVVCNFSALVVHLLWSLSNFESLTYLDTYRKELSHISNVITLINSSASFIVCCACSRLFRRTLSALCPCKRRKVKSKRLRKRFV